MEVPNGVASVECDTCHAHFDVDASDLDIQESGGQEREMGPEVFYFGQLDVHCPLCRTSIEITHESSEYPIGMPNDGETVLVGGKLVLGFSTVRHLDRGGKPIYELDGSSDLYVPATVPIITGVSAGVVALIERTDADPQLLYQLTPREFEQLCAEVLRLHGFEVHLTKRTRDGGKDIVAFQSLLGSQLKFIVECKRYAPNHHVGVDLVRSLYGVQQQEGATMAMLATTSRFTKDARAFATEPHTTRWAMDLKDFDEVTKWVRAATAKQRGRG